MTNRRFDSIGTILSRTTDSTPADRSGAENAEAAEVTARTTGVTQLRPTIRRPARPAEAEPAQPRIAKASAQSAGGVRRIAFRLDPDLHAALAGKAAADDTSQGQVVLDCVETAYTAGRLHELVAALVMPTPEGGLFPRLKGRGAAQATVPVEIRLHARAASVLDDLVEQTGASSRTQLITAALRSRLLD